MSDIDYSTRQQMSFEREDQADLAYRAVEWPDSFTPEKLTIVHLQCGYEYPISADDVRREQKFGRTIRLTCTTK